MTEIQVIDPSTLTGARVLEVRKEYGVSRSVLAQMCGFPSTGVRISNIELKESWKAGDREKVAEAIVRLQMNPPKDKNGRLKGETGVERATRLDALLRNRQNDSQINGTTTTHICTVNDENEDDVVQQVNDPDFVQELSLRNITNSEVSVWQRCRRKWWLSTYRQLSLKQQDYTGPRAVGNRVHRALAAWYVPDGQERTDPREALERAIVEDWTAVAQQERARPSYIDDEQSLGLLAAQYNQAVSLERAMIEGYVEWMIEQGDDANLRVIAPETPINAVIEGEVAGEKVRFNTLALLDVRVRRVADDVRLYVDHKTVGNFSDPRKTLHMDPQMMHYHLLEFLNTPEGEARCDGALYNMIRRVKRTPQAKPPFYDRVEVHHNSYEIDAYRRRLLGAARDIMRAERELNEGADPMSVVYPNPQRSCSWDCEFFAICPMYDDGSRVEDAITALYEVRDPMARYDRSDGQEK